MKKFIHFNSFDNFKSKRLSASADNTMSYYVDDPDVKTSDTPEIKYQQIVFIKDTQSIWTHGQLYSGKNSNTDFENYVTKEEIETHEEIAASAIVDLNTKLEEHEEVAAAAFADINNRLDTIGSTGSDDCVKIYNLYDYTDEEVIPVPCELYFNFPDLNGDADDEKLSSIHHSQIIIHDIFYRVDCFVHASGYPLIFSICEIVECGIIFKALLHAFMGIRNPKGEELDDFMGESPDDLMSLAQAALEPIGYIDANYAPKATTLAGYGINDAKIENGTITLGSNSITPLTQQDISGKADTNKVVSLEAQTLTDTLKSQVKTNLGLPTSYAPTNAELNVQSDWNLTDTSADDYIKNKPTIPTIPDWVTESEPSYVKFTELTLTDAEKTLVKSNLGIEDGPVLPNYHLNDLTPVTNSFLDITCDGYAFESDTNEYTISVELGGMTYDKCKDITLKHFIQYDYKVFELIGGDYNLFKVIIVGCSMFNLDTNKYGNVFHCCMSLVLRQEGSWYLANAADLQIHNFMYYYNIINCLQLCSTSDFIIVLIPYTVTNSVNNGMLRRIGSNTATTWEKITDIGLTSFCNSDEEMHIFTVDSGGLTSCEIASDYQIVGDMEFEAGEIYVMCIKAGVITKQKIS